MGESGRAGLRGANIADINSDRIVDRADFSIFASHWLEGGCTEPDWCGWADMDQSSLVDWDDFSVFAAHWLEGC